MAVVRAHSQLDLSDFSVWYGRVEENSSSNITVSDGYRKATYFGEFYYTYYGEVFGALKTFKYWEGSRLEVEITGIRADANHVFTAVDRGDADAAQAIILQKSDKIFGSKNSDVLFGYAGGDTIEGNASSDKLYGDGGNDKIFGGGGADRLSGGTGKDILSGDNGNDTLFGGVGQDVFVFREGHGKDRVMDFQDDIDTIRLDADLWRGDLTKHQVVRRFAEIERGDIVFDFGDEKFVIKNFTDLQEIKDDLAFI